MLFHRKILKLLNTKKELVKIIDFTGREREFTPNIPLIFVYSDGTQERVMEMVIQIEE